MKSSLCLPTASALALAALAVFSAGPAVAFRPPLPGPVLACLADCHEAREECGHACRAGFASCMSGPRLETKMCRQGCAGEFEEDTPELEACISTCHADILAPAREECRPLRQECRPACKPGRCLDICRPDGEVSPQRECREACATALYGCATTARTALRECMAPCRELTDEVEREACAAECAVAARNDAATCHEGFSTCNGECVEEPTTTTTSLPVL